MFYFLFFTQDYFQDFLEKDFWNFLSKSLENSIGIISQISIPTILNLWTVSVWQHWRMYGPWMPVRLMDKKSCRDIFPYSHTRIQMWIPLYKKKTPAALPGFSQKVLLWNYGKNFCIIFSFFISVYSFIFSLVYSHDFNLNSYRLPVRDFNLNPPLAIAKGVLLCHHQILNPASLLLQ